MNIQKIMVCLSDDIDWSQEAVHLACTLSRNTPSEVVLVQMARVQHISWSGTLPGYLGVDPGGLQSCLSIVEDYQLVPAVLLFQYHDLLSGIVDAANHVNASIVLASLPDHRFKWWYHWRMNHLAHALEAQQRHLYSLDKPAKKVAQSLGSPAIFGKK